MAKLLYVEASPRKQRSFSIAVAKVFLEAYKTAHPADQLDEIDLWTFRLPEFNDAALNAKYAVLHGTTQTPDQTTAWKEVATIADRIKSVDKLVFSVPMWNFSIPYKLKHFIDVITQPGITFSFSPSDGYKGLVTGKKAMVIYSRGGAYPANTPWEAYDLQKRYMELWLGFIGVTDLKSIVVDSTLGEAAEDAKSSAREKAREIARDF